MDQIIKFTYKEGQSRFVDYLLKNNQLNLVKQLLISKKIDETLVSEIETSLNCSSEDIITLVENVNISTRGYIRILQQFEPFSTELFKVYRSKEKQIPTLYIQDKEHCLTALMFTWKDLVSLIEKFDFVDFLSI